MSVSMLFSDDAVINLWKQGYSIDKIAKKVAGKTPSSYDIDKITRIILNFQSGKEKNI